MVGTESECVKAFGLLLHPNIFKKAVILIKIDHDTFTTTTYHLAARVDRKSIGVKNWETKKFELLWQPK